MKKEDGEKLEIWEKKFRYKMVKRIGKEEEEKIKVRELWGKKWKIKKI